MCFKIVEDWIDCTALRGVQPVNSFSGFNCTCRYPADLAPYDGIFPSARSILICPTKVVGKIQKVFVPPHIDIKFHVTSLTTKLSIQMVGIGIEETCCIPKGIDHSGQVRRQFRISSMSNMIMGLPQLNLLNEFTTPHPTYKPILSSTCADV